MGAFDFLLVAIGGALGSLLRGLISYFLISFSPWPTLAVNLTGAFFIGVLVKLMENSTTPDYFRAFWIIGVCGGFTTFSTFGMEMMEFIKASQWTWCLIYVTLNVVGSICAIFGAFRLLAFLQP